MAQVTAALVKQLREMTDSPMMECKKALVEADGDIEKAVDVLRTMGLAKAVKRAGRDTNEGTIAAYISEDGKTGALLELTCETDFVGTNAKFRAFAESLAKVVAEVKPANLEELLAAPMNGKTVDEELKENIHVFGENQKINRFQFVTTEGTLVKYIHHDGKHADIVEFTVEDADAAKADAFLNFARDVAMQVIAMNPVAAKREDVSSEVVDHEVEIAKAQAANSGKPEAIQEKMALGKLEKFFKENVLGEQAYVKDGSVSINELAEKVSKELGKKVELVDFIRYNFGE